MGRAGESGALGHAIGLTSENGGAAQPKRRLFGRRKRKHVRVTRHLSAATVRAMRERVLFRHKVVRYAKHFLGVRYVYGGSSPRSGFDCSGFVRYVYQHFGISLPHSSWGDMVRGKRVARNNLLPGDILFFDGGGHVGIYVGNGRFIHAPHTGTVVRIQTLAGWYSGLYDGARRMR
ncbi:MAG TPA: C40 family peptidase [Gaiellaceae bacterium]|nr:C40 family peptidase [Gaiellaceae bacterium]